MAVIVCPSLSDDVYTVYTFDSFQSEMRVVDRLAIARSLAQMESNGAEICVQSVEAEARQFMNNRMVFLRVRVCTIFY